MPDLPPAHASEPLRASLKCARAQKGTTTPSPPPAHQVVGPRWYHRDEASGRPRAACVRSRFRVGGVAGSGLQKVPASRSSVPAGPSSPPACQRGIFPGPALHGGREGPRARCHGGRRGPSIPAGFSGAGRVPGTLAVHSLGQKAGHEAGHSRRAPHSPACGGLASPLRRPAVGYPGGRPHGACGRCDCAVEELRAGA